MNSINLSEIPIGSYKVEFVKYFSSSEIPNCWCAYTKTTGELGE